MLCTIQLGDVNTFSRRNTLARPDSPVSGVRESTARKDNGIGAQRIIT